MTPKANKDEYARHLHNLKVHDAAKAGHLTFALCAPLHILRDTGSALLKVDDFEATTARRLSIKTVGQARRVRGAVVPCPPPDRRRVPPRTFGHFLIGL